MFQRLMQFLEEKLDQPRSTGAAPDDYQLAIAATALMLQLAGVDRQEDERELAVILEIAGNELHVDEADQEELLSIARERAEDAISLYEFTSHLTDYLGHAERMQLLEKLWRVALADERLDKYEEHMIRRVADLLHLSPNEFIQCKLRVQERQA
ncbi:TerB family tellurite resistance protein [Marinobacteraceae bacterium S3BR75-40.1]